MSKMLESEVRAILDSRLRAALTKQGSELSNDREQAMNFYFGRPMGNEQEGRAQVVSKDLMDTVEWIMPSLMRIFCTMEAVQFDPVGPEDEQLAKEETGYVRHVLWKKNAGFMLLYEWIKTFLLQKVGYVKYWWEDTEKVSFRRYTGLTDEGLTLLMQDLEEHGEVDVVEQEQDDNGTWSIKLKLTTEYGCAKVDGAPPEEVIVSADCKGSIKTAKFVGHLRTDLTRSDLIEMGYDKERVKKLTDYNWSLSLSEKIARDSVSESTQDSDADADWPSENIKLLEAYTYLDEDDDGVAELRCMLLSGNEVLEDEEAEEIQWCSATPIPVPFRHIGLSMYDIMEDLQRIHTALKRGLLDNVYFTNAPRLVYDSNTVDLATLQINRPGAHIANNGPAAGAVAPVIYQPIADRLLPIINYFDDVRDKRTGSSAMQTGADADVLAQSTKGAYMQAVGAANQRIEAIARIFAETGMADLYKSLHKLLVENQDWAEKFRLRNKWVEQKIPPTEWQQREHLTVAVGLGNAGAQEVRANLGLMAQAQEKAAMVPGIVQPRNVYALAKRMQTELGLENEDFFTDPESPEYAKWKSEQTPPADPYVEGKKIDAQVKTADIQARGQEKVIDLADKREDRAARRDQWITELEVGAAVDLAKPGIGAEVAGGKDSAGTGRTGAAAEQSAQ
jgi:hypothetical protein